MRKGFWMVGLALALLVVATPTQAAPIIIDFGTGTAGAGGTITVVGGVYTGTGIPVPALTAIGTAANSGVYVTDAVLNFTFGGGSNTITIVGGFAPANIAAGSTLLSGSFTLFNPTNPSGLLSIQAAGNDLKNTALLTYFGIPLTTPFNFYGFTIAANITPAGAGVPTWQPYSTDMSNSNIPEPGTMLLLGTGLIGLAGAVRRRLKK